MEKRGKIQKLTSFLLVFVMLLGVMLQSKLVFAEGLERVDTQITDFTVTTSSGEIPPDGFSINNALRIGISWDASFYQNNLKEGDYFNVSLPKEFIFPEDYSACNFDIKTPDGNDVVAKAVVTPDATNGGGVITVTFTKYVEDKYHIKGSMFLNATFNKDLIKQGEVNVISVAIGSHPTSIEINVKPQTSNPLNDEALSKWSRNKLFNGNVRWEMRINHKKGNLSNAIITDELSSEDGDMTGIHYIPDSFKLMEIQADEYGNTTWTGPVTNVSNDVVFSDNNTKFSYRLGDISGKQYFLIYDTTYKPNIKLHNKVTLANEQQTWTSSSSAVFAESGGQGSGDLLSKIKIIKVDSEDNEIKLAGAIFEVTRLSDNTTFTLTTNSEGEILSDKLIPGKYKIKETTQPVGYILNDETFEVDVKADGACIQTIKNEPVKTNITVEKRWIGEAGAPVTAILKADGTEVARHELTAATSWKHTFENLRKYQPGTDTEIVYTVEEETVPQGYTVSYETDPTGILVIKNTQDKTEVKVTKAWEDNNDQDGKRPASVTIKLLADGEEVSGKTLTLTEANNWTGTFTDLVKYKAGKKIKYTIKEESVGNGYVSAITGSAEDGYKVTNTREPEKINVEGKKTWNDKDNQDGKRPAEITINLLKNGTKIDSVKVKEADGWKWKFEGLDKYENGNVITYSITEERVEGYSAEINGYDVKNSYTPGKISVQVTKAWEDNNDQDGVRPNSVTIKLLADGKETGKTLTLTKANNWTVTFTDLDEYKAGKKIEYTVKEESVGNGYVSAITGSAEDGYKVTNTREPEKINVEGKKTWNDKDNQDGKRPAEITINLLKNGAVVETKTITEADGWKWKFEGLDKYENGNEITYSISEERVEGYSAEINGYDVKNSYTPGKISVQVTKAWEDKNDQDGVRPNSVTIKLLADGKETGKTLTLTKADNWTGTFTDLDEYKAGKKIKYTIKEEPVGNGYVSVITGSAEDGYVVTNVRTPNTPPEKPNKPNLPKTGDGSNMSLYALLMLTSGTLLLFVGYRRRKQAK